MRRQRCIGVIFLLLVYLFTFNLDKIVLAESKYINELFVLQSVIQKMVHVIWKRQMG